MRVIVLGGTRFIGRAITEALTAAGHTVLVAHRGLSEPDGLPASQHLHAERAAWPGHAAAFAAFGGDAAVDVSAGNGDDARAALAALPPGLALVALSSVDVYRAYESLRRGRQTDLVPLTEESPLRAGRHIDGRRGRTWMSRRPTSAPGRPSFGSARSTASTTTSTGSNWCCAASGRGAPGCPSARAASRAAAFTPGTSPGRCSPPWRPAGAPGSA